MEMVVEKDSAAIADDIIGGLNSLLVSKKDKWRVQEAIERMERVQRRTVVTGGGISRGILMIPWRPSIPCFQ